MELKLKKLNFKNEAFDTLFDFGYEFVRVLNGERIQCDKYYIEDLDRSSFLRMLGNGELIASLYIGLVGLSDSKIVFKIPRFNDAENIKRVYSSENGEEIKSAAKNALESYYEKSVPDGKLSMTDFYINLLSSEVSVKEVFEKIQWERLFTDMEWSDDLSFAEKYCKFLNVGTEGGKTEDGSMRNAWAVREFAELLKTDDRDKGENDDTVGCEEERFLEADVYDYEDDDLDYEEDKNIFIEDEDESDDDYDFDDDDDPDDDEYDFEFEDGHDFSFGDDDDDPDDDDEYDFEFEDSHDFNFGDDDEYYIERPLNSFNVTDKIRNGMNELIDDIENSHIRNSTLEELEDDVENINGVKFRNGLIEVNGMAGGTANIGAVEIVDKKVLVYGVYYRKFEPVVFRSSVNFERDRFKILVGGHTFLVGDTAELYILFASQKGLG